MNNRLRPRVAIGFMVSEITSAHKSPDGEPEGRTARARPCYNRSPRAGFDPEVTMTYHRKFPTVVVLCALCLLFTTTRANAYVDPNAAGLISQIIIPLLIAAAAGVTFLRKQMSPGFFALSRRFRRRVDA